LGLYNHLYNWKACHYLFIFYFLLLFVVGCGRSPVIGTHPTLEKDTLLEAIAPVKPNWLTETPERPGYKCFVGKGEKMKEKEAEEEAIMNMLERYAQFLGADYRILTQIHREEIAQKSDIYQTRGIVKTDAEILAGIITAGSEIKKRYWEKWQKMSGKSIEYPYYKYWVLGEVEDSFIKEERERIKAIRLTGFDELMQDIPPNSNLSVEIRENKGKYKVGDELVIRFWSNESCYCYILNFYGEGKVRKLYSDRLDKDIENVLKATAEYCGKPEEIIKFVVSNKSLDIDKALNEVYPMSIIKNLRSQAKELEARYAEKSILIFIVPK